ncbi:hypothetical protein CEXT_372851 [Caerostris extrusa]|uniref:Uncharacterized protein n=1 Tax=Caerostris extrusa TaxID=172846 RepID=A0AAV4NA86_CAEEX|nr:hypothetical protein CEXT_372851 [Caerostris extrusa]
MQQTVLPQIARDEFALNRGENFLLWEIVFVLLSIMRFREQMQKHILVFLLKVDSSVEFLLEGQIKMERQRAKVTALKCDGIAVQVAV